MHPGSINTSSRLQRPRGAKRGIPAQLKRAIEALNAGRLAEAEAALASVIEREPMHFDASQLMGALYHQRGEFELAISYFRKAIQENDQVAAVHNNLATSLAAIGLSSQAAASYQRALRLEPSNNSFRKNLANVYVALDQYEQAAEQIRLALKQSPDDYGLQQSLQGLSQRAGLRPPEGRSIEANTETAQSSAPQSAANEFWAQLERSKAQRKSGAAEAAVETLRSLSGAADAAKRRNWGFALAVALDACGRYEEAFEVLTEANRIAATMDAAMVQPAAYLDDVAAHRGVARLVAEHLGDESQPESQPGCPVPPAFVVGFPRSGTTLLAQMLDAHPQLTALQEMPMLESLRQEIFCLPAGYPQSLGRLSVDDRERLQAEYFRLVAPMTSAAAEKRIVDVSATHLRYVPLIRSIFPQSPVLLIVRHPNDVCLSCLMKDFKANDLAANFHTLKDAAVAYRDTMELTEPYLEICPSLSAPIRYERLVASPRLELERVCRELGCEFDHAMLEFHERAQLRTIKTASHDQVTRPLYTSAIDRWRRYETRLNDVAPILSPWIQHWGYEC